MSDVWVCIFMVQTILSVLKYVFFKQNDNIPIFIDFNKSFIIVQIDRNWFHITESLVHSGVTTGGYQVYIFLMPVKMSLYVYVTFIHVEACQSGLNTILAWWNYLQYSIETYMYENTGRCYFMSGIHSWNGDRGGTVVKVLCYKSEGLWFNSKWCHWNFSLT